MNKKKVVIYTDGACSGNPGPGGFGIILQYGEYRKEISQGFLDTTNNRMELLAVITALEALNSPCIVDLYSDSKYVIDAIQKGWAVKWRSKGWMRTAKEPAKNPDLWKRLLDLLEIHDVTFHWVKGHAQNANNNRCDELAVAAWKKLK
jgi:ribonuclease HI